MIPNAVLLSISFAQKSAIGTRSRILTGYVQDFSLKNSITVSVFSVMLGCTYFVQDTAFAVHKFQKVLGTPDVL